MTDEDMFETMDRILGEKSGGMKDTIEVDESIQDQHSKPSHPLWKLIDQWGGTMYLSVNQLEPLFKEVEP